MLSLTQYQYKVQLQHHAQYNQHQQQAHLIALAVVEQCASYQQVLLSQLVAHTRRSMLALNHRVRLAKTR